jgi:hypothetical protein
LVLTPLEHSGGDVVNKRGGLDVKIPKHRVRPPTTE